MPCCFQQIIIVDVLNLYDFAQECHLEQLDTLGLIDDQASLPLVAHPMLRVIRSGTIDSQLVSCGEWWIIMGQFPRNGAILRKT